MRYPASEKAEIIQLVEQSHLPAKRTLDNSASPAPRSTAGMIDTLKAGLRRWVTTLPTRSCLEPDPGQCPPPDHRSGTGGS